MPAAKRKATGGNAAPPPKKQKSAPTSVPDDLHTTSGEGRVAYECGWAVVNWISTHYGGARIAFDGMMAVQAQLQEQEQEQARARGALQQALAGGWFSVEALELALENAVGQVWQPLWPGPTPRGLASKVQAVAFVTVDEDEDESEDSPQTRKKPAETKWGHWFVALRRGKGTCFDVLDTDEPASQARGLAALLQRFPLSAHNAYYLA
eukprot:TRINITY_DN8812_c0_g1_i1.p1 TRINITY_DN8812_c0_g1~~TRINITY_DN8812_c0_g1_i1.p1  ORF type:complete len:208 (+),score=48.12 TRINITY_DN8812_c0_g1_i1:189-812(+)